MSSPHRSIRMIPHLVATVAIMLATSLSLLGASPVAASTAEDKPTDEVDCAPVALGEDEWEDFGLVGRREYESPQFGTGVDWDRAWAVDEASDYAIGSNEECQYDELRLMWEDDELYGRLILNFSIPSDVKAMDELVDDWSGKKFLASNWGEGYTGEVAVADSDDTTAEAVFSVIGEEDNAQYYVIYRTIALSDDTWLYLTLTTDEASFEDAWAALDEGVRVDGEPIPAALTWRKIQRGL